MYYLKNDLNNICNEIIILHNSIINKFLDNTDWVYRPPMSIHQNGGRRLGWSDPLGSSGWTITTMLSNHSIIRMMPWWHRPSPEGALLDKHTCKRDIRQLTGGVLLFSILSQKFRERVFDNINYEERDVFSLYLDGMWL